LYTDLVDAFEKEGGYKDQLENCHVLAAERDPKNIAGDETVNTVCKNAAFAMEVMVAPYFYNGTVSWVIAFNSKADNYRRAFTT
jgi:hypothetical protein